MKKVLALLLMLLMVLAFGCVFGEDDKDNDKDDSGSGGVTLNLQAGDYVPLKIGNTWNFSDKGTAWGESFEDNSTETISKTELIDSKSYFVLEEDEYESSYLRIADNAVYSREWIPDTVARPAIIAAAEAEKEYKMMDFSKKTGESWTALEYVDNDEWHNSDYKMTVKLVGLRDVTVPAGTFKDCVAFETTVVSNYRFTSDGETYTELWKSTVTTYLAKGVGPVKYVSKTDITAHGQNESGESSSSELTSYELAD